MAASRAFEFDSGGSLAAYNRKIRSYALLSDAEETELVRRYRQSGDRGAADALVTAHLRLVVKIAKGYRGYGMPVADLISEGCIGLLQAVRGFDPDRGVRFATYALCWIRAAIQEYILRTWSLVRIGTTGAQKKLFFNLRRIKAQMKGIEDGRLGPEQIARIARELDVDEKDVTMMEQRLASPELSLNAPMGDGDSDEWQEKLSDGRISHENVIAEAQEANRHRAFLYGALEGLTHREKGILVERRLKERPATLQTLSDRYGVSRERIRQIELRALEKLRVTARVSGFAASDRN
jgi:RNA polymerase sigma-32 factor